MERVTHLCPYIDRDSRADLEPHIRPLAEAIRHQSVGVVNYTLTRLLHEWLGPAPSYATYNAAIGIVECAKLELYRKQAAPYEDLKLVANGPLPEVK